MALNMGVRMKIACACALLPLMAGALTIVEEGEPRAAIVVQTDSPKAQRAAEAGEDLDAEPADDLLGMEGMDEGLAYTLARRGVVTMDDLAEQSVDELMEIEGMDEEWAARLIMKAREPWVAGSEQD